VTSVACYPLLIHENRPAPRNVGTHRIAPGRGIPEVRDLNLYYNGAIGLPLGVEATDIDPFRGGAQGWVAPTIHLQKWCYSFRMADHSSDHGGCSKCSAERVRNAATALLASGLLAIAAACDSSRLPCYGPADCGGNACCLRIPILAGPITVACGASPDACPPSQTFDMSTTRLCQTEADCTAGGISTSENKCCRASVSGHAAKSCTGPSRCFNSSALEAAE
jgi:hypothetical protein